MPVEPADPFTEALRTAEEIGAEVIFLEPDSLERPHLPDTYPDTYAIRRIGLERYIEAYRVWPQTAHRRSRRARLRHGLEAARRRPVARSVVVVVSLNLLDPLLDAMETPQDAPARAAESLSTCGC